MGRITAFVVTLGALAFLATGWFVERNWSAESPNEPSTYLSNRSDEVSARNLGLESAELAELPEILEGEEHSWRDGNRRMTARLATNLVLQPTSENSAADVVFVENRMQSVVLKRTEHSEASPPVFVAPNRELMSLPGGILLALDPDWTSAEADQFLARNGVSTEHVSRQRFTKNSYLIYTDPGFAALEMANRLAEMPGVEISSPNWMRHVSRR